MYCTCLHVVQVAAFCCGNDSLSVMPEFSHTSRNITEKSGPKNNANNVSSEGLFRIFQIYIDEKIETAQMICLHIAKLKSDRRYLDCVDIS